MAKKQEPFVSVTGGPARGGETPRALNTALDRFLGIQRPVVLAHLRSIRRRHPDATGPELAAILERRYLAAVTTGGAAVGATAVIPAIGTGVTLALSGLETAGFLEATALYAQSLGELHGIAVDDPERARALVLTMMLGREGSELVRQLAGQFGGAGLSRSAYWGELVTSSLPSALVGPLVDRLKSAFIRHFAVRGGAGIIGRALPFGVGAVIGGTGNHIVGRRVVQNSRLAFGPAPLQLPAALDAAEGPNPVYRLGAAAGGRALAAGRVLRGAMPRLRRDKGEGPDEQGGTAVDAPASGSDGGGRTRRLRRGRSRASGPGEAVETPTAGAEPASGRGAIPLPPGRTGSTATRPAGGETDSADATPLSPAPRTDAEPHSERSA